MPLEAGRRYTSSGTEQVPCESFRQHGSSSTAHVPLELRRLVVEEMFLLFS